MARLGSQGRSSAMTKSYYLTQTLMGGSRDANSRTIYNSKDEPVCTFNPGMSRAWNCEDERLLGVVLKALIEDAAPKYNIEECGECFGTGTHQGKFGGPDWPLCTNCGGRGKLLVE
jgi:hypothetical protein